jgi:hypothetical protein
MERTRALLYGVFCVPPQYAAHCIFRRIGQKTPERDEREPGAPGSLGARTIVDF